MPANNFQPVTCVPEVSLLDPNEFVRTDSNDKITFKLWKKHKIPHQTNLANTDPVKIPEVVAPSNAIQCDENRYRELTTVVEQQQVEIDRLRNDNASLRRDYDEMKQTLRELSLRVDEMRGSQSTSNEKSKQSDFTNSHQSGRWSLPMNPAESLEISAERRILLDSNSHGRAPPDKSQMMNNLFRKYFPQSEENLSPSNQPIFEYNEPEKSIATFNYLTKYKLLGSNERVLDISKLKKQSKLMH